MKQKNGGWSRRNFLTATAVAPLIVPASVLGRGGAAAPSERLQLASEEISQARERFTNGVAGNIEVINAQSSLVRARDADIDARFAVASARVALARAAGVARNIH